MKKYILTPVLLLLIAGCDYNDKYFEELKDREISDLVSYEGEYTGDYPEDGYFTSREEVEKKVAAMLATMFAYCDSGSTAKINIQYGDITPGFETADESYTLTDEDYDSMGEESGQPGRYNNFDANMDINAYLTVFCADKYPNAVVGFTASITYKYYANNVTTNQSRCYQKVNSGWEEIDLVTFGADLKYVLQAEDYDSMGEESGQPGRYDNFDANMDVDQYLTVFLSLKYPYAQNAQTAEITYNYYENYVTTPVSRFYKYDGRFWEYYDPYADTVDVSTKVADMVFDGKNWTMARLMGGTAKIIMTNSDYQILVEWVIENKPEYISTKYPDTEEYYFGASSYYPNINNAYDTWKDYYDPINEYVGLSNEELQVLMDERLAWGLANVMLPALYPNPDPGLVYVVTYKIYKGRGDGNYNMSFVYQNDDETFEWVGGPIAE